ncbi:MAG: hypothetical protein R3A48_03560 [Polyangiales bacterium]
MSARASHIALGLMLAGCADGGATAQDAGRFDVREAAIAPLDAPKPPRDVAAPSVDVRGADAPARADVGALDAQGTTPPQSCIDVANEHAAAVREAQRCLIDADCDARVCETLCCACEVYVRGASGEAALARAIAARADAVACVSTLQCPRVPCERPSRAVCSSAGRCVTLRGAADDAGVFDATP